MATSPPLGQFSNTPVFNTKAVARDTEVPADTFRAWERRYGIPSPHRTAGGHRLYSERDIAIIRWLRDRTAEGMNISQAVTLLVNSLSEAKDVASVPLPVPTSIEPRTLQRLHDELLAALMVFDSHRSDHLLSEAFALYSIEDVVLSVIQPMLVEMGERWHRGEINVAMEHFATLFVRRKLSELLNVFAGSEREQRKIIMACAPNEVHDIGALVGALFLARRGWQVIYFGSQVPLADLLETIQTLKPELICLSASMPDTAHQLREVAQAILKQFPHLTVGYGGRAFNMHPELRASMAGVYLGQNARDLADSVTRLMARGSTSNSSL